MGSYLPLTPIIMPVQRSIPVKLPTPRANLEVLQPGTPDHTLQSSDPITNVAMVERQLHAPDDSVHGGLIGVEPAHLAAALAEEDLLSAWE